MACDAPAPAICDLSFDFSANARFRGQKKLKNGERGRTSTNMERVNSMASRPLKLVPQSVSDYYNLLPRFQSVLTELSASRTLEAGERALDQVSEILGLPYPAWVSDVANPYYSSRLDRFAKERGWPEELMELWWDRNAALKMPLYIRCRFEHLPFVSCLEKRPHNSTRAAHEEHRIGDILRGMGATVMLTVPIHLPKSQIAMMTWAGNQCPNELRRILPAISGHLLGIGHFLMGAAQQDKESACFNLAERSHLTPREWDCIRTLAQGYREAEVADLNSISKVTVRFHLDNVMQKFGCRTRTQAVALAAQLGLLGPIGA
jgi:DNA-binding CsgD family transcriptional regulator